MHYMSATPAELRSAYWDARKRLARLGDLASSVSSPKGRKTVARGTGFELSQFDLICNVARKRGIDLLAPGEPEAVDEHAEHGEGWHCFADSAACFEY